MHISKEVFENSPVEFRGIRGGDTFVMENRLFIKTCDSFNFINALNLKTGEHTHVGPLDKVTPVNTTVVRV